MYLKSLSRKLIEAMKKPQPEPTDAEKVKAANELHDWLTRKDETK